LCHQTNIKKVHCLSTVSIIQCRLFFMQTKFIDLGLVYVSLTTYMRVYGQTTQFLTSRMNQTTKKNTKKLILSPNKKLMLNHFLFIFLANFLVFYFSFFFAFFYAACSQFPLHMIYWFRIEEHIKKRRKPKHKIETMKKINIIIFRNLDIKIDIQIYLMFRISVFFFTFYERS
jgi:hypothetical protein